MQKYFLSILCSAIILSCTTHSNPSAVPCHPPLDSIDFNSYNLEKAIGAKVDYTDTLDPQLLLKDFQILQFALEEACPNIYRYASKNTMDSLFAAKRCSIAGGTTYQGFTRIIAEVFNEMACGHSGWRHAVAFEEFRDSAMKFLPLTIASFNDQYFITGNFSGNPDLNIGDEIEAINGQTPSEMNALFRRHMNRDGSSIPHAESEITRYFPRAYVNFIDHPEQYELKIKINGQLESHIIRAVPEFAIDSIKQKTIVEQPSNQPLLSFKMDSSNLFGIYSIKTFRKEKIEDQGQDFDQFTAAVFEQCAADNLKNLVIDLRGNTGGWTEYGKNLFAYFAPSEMPYITSVGLSRVNDFSFDSLLLFDQGIVDTMEFEKGNDQLMYWVNNPNLYVHPKSPKFNGLAYILIDENTRSCSSIFSSMMQAHTDARFIGTENGSSQCGQGGMLVGMVLPYTGIQVRFSTGKYISNVTNLEDTRGVQVDYAIRKHPRDTSDTDLHLAKVRRLILKNE